MDLKSESGAGFEAGSPPGTQGRQAPMRGPGAAGPSSSPPGASQADDAARLAKQGAQEVRHEAREAKDAATRAAHQAAAQLRDAAQSGSQQVREQAGDVLRQVRERGASLLDEQKDRATAVLSDCVAATRRAAEKLHRENDHNIAGYADVVADRLESVNGYLRQADAGRLVSDAAHLARRRPEWVLGGAFVVGLAISRFLKANRPGGAASGTSGYDAGRQGTDDSGPAAHGYAPRPSASFDDTRAAHRMNAATAAATDQAVHAGTGAGDAAHAYDVPGHSAPPTASADFAVVRPVSPAVPVPAATAPIAGYPAAVASPTGISTMTIPGRSTSGTGSGASGGDTPQSGPVPGTPHNALDREVH